MLLNFQIIPSDDSNKRSAVEVRAVWAAGRANGGGTLVKSEQR